MRNYSVEIEETLKTTVIVEAQSKEDALIKVKEQYDNEKIVLDYSNYYGTSISVDLEN